MYFIIRKKRLLQFEGVFKCKYRSKSIPAPGKKPILNTVWTANTVHEFGKYTIYPISLINRFLYFYKITSF